MSSAPFLSLRFVTRGFTLGVEGHLSFSSLISLNYSLNFASEPYKTEDLFYFFFLKYKLGTSLVAQCLRIRLPMQGTRV